jgi:hypothetical protein
MQDASLLRLVGKEFHRLYPQRITTRRRMGQRVALGTTLTTLKKGRKMQNLAILMMVFRRQP